MRRNRQARRLACALALVPAAINLASPAQATAESWGSGFDTSRSRVPYSGKVTLRGAFKERSVRPVRSEDGGTAETAATSEAATRPARNRPVQIQYRIAGVRSWKVVSHTRTGAAGKFKERVKLRRTGFLRARLADGTLTRQRKVRVASKLRPKVKNRHVDAGGRTRIRGHVNPGSAGRKVIVTVGSVKRKTRTGSGGRFSVKVPVNSLGTRKVVVRAKGDRAATGSRRKAGKVTAYRQAMASWYGPGFYGNRTACGQTLTTDMLGVAHKTLPCGTKLKLRYGGRSVQVRVIDRGPFHPGREFDLTGATKQRLGFGSTGYIRVNR